MPLFSKIWMLSEPPITFSLFCKKREKKIERKKIFFPCNLCWGKKVKVAGLF